MMISVIIPVLNEAVNLKRLLPYLKQISDKNTEIIVCVSVESSDESVDICREHGVRYIHTYAADRAIQMNAGAGFSIGDVLCFLHADVMPPVQFTGHIRKKVSLGYKFGIFAYRFDSLDKCLAFNAWFTQRKGVFSGGGDQIHFVEKQLFYELGKYDERCGFMEDFRFFSKIKTYNIPYCIIKDTALVSARKYSTNSYIRVNIANLLIFIFYKMDVPGKVLKKMYKKWLNPY
jgi:glycosyltransferase involved in cell wall biosynthesis